MSVFGVILVRIFPAFSRIRTEHGEILRISPFLVRMRENAGKMGTIITPNTDTFYVVFIKNFCHSLTLRDYFFWNYFLLIFPGYNFCLATSETWTRTLDPDSEKHGINMRLKDMSGFGELHFIKTMRNVICCLKVHLLTNIYIIQAKNCSYNNSTVKLKSWKHQEY